MRGEEARGGVKNTKRVKGAERGGEREDERQRGRETERTG